MSVLFFLNSRAGNKFHSHGKDVTFFPHIKQEDKQSFAGATAQCIMKTWKDSRGTSF